VHELIKIETYVIDVHLDELKNTHFKELYKRTIPSLFMGTTMIDNLEIFIGVRKY
jgi:hypothetical protein